MANELKPGDALYRVYSSTFGDILEVATVEAVRPQTVRIKGGGSAFGWRRTLTLDEAAACPRTREAAVQAAIERAEANVAHAEQMLSRLRDFSKPRTP